MVDWRFKIFAYLHDPPDKPLAIQPGARRDGGHAAWGRQLAVKLAGEPAPGGSEVRLIERADHLASGADRSPMLPSGPPALDDLRHPLSGDRVDLSQHGEMGPAAVEQGRVALLEEFEVLSALRDAPPAAFLALWGLLSRRLRARRGANELGALWDLLPAETRMPNHPVAAHQTLVSALATVLKAGEEAALLVVTIGPVQSFIAQARRTSDLWAGSDLLSRALLQACRPVVEQLGPDHIIFPSLRRSALFMAWLLEESPWAERLGTVAPAGWPAPVSVAALPNRFLAIVPAGHAAELAGACEDAVRRWWVAEAVTAARRLEDQDAALAGFTDLASAQMATALQVTWAVTPWPTSERVEPRDPACRRAAWTRGGRLPPPTEAFIEHGARERRHQVARAFAPNGGTLYGVAYDAVDGLMAAVKRTRAVPTRVEDGLKCSLCGERGVVPAAMRFEEQKEVWRRVRAHVSPSGGVRAGEALCGVCWTKRARGVAASRAPSTAEVAATPFKRAVLARLDTVRPAVEALCEAVDRLARLPQAYVLPALLDELQAGGLRARFARIDGELLLAHPRTDRDLAEGGVIPEAILSAAATLRRAAAEAGIAPPRPYLAALVLDGDEMGRWLSGEKNLDLGRYLSDAARSELEADGAGEYLDRPWPMTPALHAAFSEACGVFSQRSARRTLREPDHPGFLVYAGGDDVLALSPVGCPDAVGPFELATRTALALRLRFSGHVRRDPGKRGDVPDPDTRAGYVLDPEEGLALALGQRVTASVGIAVFHHRWPLGRALAEARRAERFAKDELGRDALGLAILRRSGQVTRTGVRFALGDGAGGINGFGRLAHAFGYDRLSPRFLAEIKGRLGSFRGGLESGALLDLARPIVMAALASHVQRGNDETGNSLIEPLTQALDSLCRAAHGVAPEDPRVPADRAQLTRWLDLVEAAAFLGRGGQP